MAEMMNYWEMARDSQRTADREADRARRDARFAAEQYELARGGWRHAAWLTRHPELWGPDRLGTPAEAESLARVTVRLADTFLRASFHSTAYARRSRAWAHDYGTRAREREPYLARYYPAGRAWLATPAGRAWAASTDGLEAEARHNALERGE